jgi:hypothetical protein
VNQIHNQPTRRSKVGADYSLPFICFACGTPARRVVNSTCEACLRDNGLCVTCGKPTDDDGYAHCADHLPYCIQCEESGEDVNEWRLCAKCAGRNAKSDYWLDADIAKARGK